MKIQQAPPSSLNPGTCPLSSIIKSDGAGVSDAPAGKIVAFPVKGRRENRQLLGNRSRPWGPVKSSTGPMGTMPVGLISVCVM